MWFILEKNVQENVDKSKLDFVPTSVQIIIHRFSTKLKVGL